MMDSGRHQKLEPRTNPPASNDLPFEYNYTPRDLQESPEPMASLAGGVNRTNASPHYRYLLPREGYFQPSPRGSAPAGEHNALQSFHSQGEIEWSPGRVMLVASHLPPPPPDPLANIQRYHEMQGRAEYVPNWLAGQHSPPSDPVHVRRSGPATVPSFEHSGMAQANAEHPYTPPYERSHLSAWKELQYTGEFRRREMEARVLREDYVRITGPATAGGRGSQSSGSGNSLSSGGATGGSCGWTGQDVISECEFCGRRDLLSTLKDHWLNCKHRTAVPPSRQGIWMNR